MKARNLKWVSLLVCSIMFASCSNGSKQAESDSNEVAVSEANDIVSAIQAQDKIATWEITDNGIETSKMNKEGKCEWQIFIHKEWNNCKTPFVRFMANLYDDIQDFACDIDFGGVKFDTGKASKRSEYTKVEGTSDNVDELLKVMAKGNFDIVITRQDTNEKKIIHIGDETLEADKAFEKSLNYGN